MKISELTEQVDVWVITALVISLLIGVVFAAVKTTPVLRKFAAFLNDVAGEEARPGRPRVPGLFERMSNIEETQKQVLSTVGVIHHEIFPNSGKSLRDQTNRIEDKVSKDYQEITRLKSAQTRLEKLVEEHLAVSTEVLTVISEEEK